MMHRDALEETCCERSPADFWHGGDPLDAAQMTLPPAYPKARTPSGEAGQLQNRPFVHRTGCSSIGRVVRPSDGLGRSWGVLGVHRTGWASICHRNVLVYSTLERAVFPVVQDACRIHGLQHACFSDRFPQLVDRCHFVG